MANFDDPYKDINIPGFNIALPQFDPLDPSGINMIKSRLAEADKLAADPLSAPGVQASLQSLQANLSRRAESARGAAMGRAAGTGQGGFQGALAQTGADIEARQGEAFAGAQSDMAMKIFQQARSEGLSLTDALNRAQAEAAKITTQQAAIRAQTAAQEAEINSRIRMQQADINARQRADYMQRLLDKAKLAEQTRQFDVTSKFGEREFGLKEKAFGLQEKNVGFEKERLAQQQRQFDREQALKESMAGQESMANRMRNIMAGAQSGLLPFGQAQGLFGKYGGFGNFDFGAPSFQGGGFLTEPWERRR